MTIVKELATQMKKFRWGIALLLAFLHQTCLADLTPLLAAVEAGDAAVVTNLLKQNMNLEVRNQRGWTPLVIATEQGNVVIASLLVAKGADVNARSTSIQGSTALCFAAQRGDTALLELLLKRGADINARSKNGGTALCSAVDSKQEAAILFLIARGAKIDQLAYMNDQGRLFTPLILAATEGDMKTAELLLANGAGLEKRNNFGNTPLMEAAMHPQTQMVKFLIDRRANINAKNPRGYTALLHAVDHGHTENIKMLLTAGANPFASYRITDDPADRSWDGVDLAKMHGDNEIARLILDAQKRAQPAASSSN